MPYRYPPELRGKVLDRLAAGRSVASLSADPGVSDQTIYNWRRQDAVHRGVEPGLSSSEKEELRAARRRIAELATELAVDRYMQDEGSNNLRVGHRRQILSAFVEEIGTGNVYDEDGPHRAANAMHLGYDYSSDATVREPSGFVAWPPPATYPPKRYGVAGHSSYPTRTSAKQQSPSQTPTVPSPPRSSTGKVLSTTGDHLGYARRPELRAVSTVP